MRNGKLMTKRVAAIALSSMMVLSPLTALASSGTTGTPATKEDQYGSDFDIQTGQTDGVNDYFLDSTRDPSNKSKITANFKKTLVLEDRKNTDYIPSVPDVTYNYTIEVNDFNAGKTSGVPSYNGAKIFKGIEGGVSSTATTTFSHTQDPKADKDGFDDTITNLVAFDVFENKFQGEDPGVYRYILTEAEYKNLDGVQAGSAQDVLDDINEISDQYNQRFVDVVVQRANEDPTSDARIVTGVILHEIIKEFDESSQSYVIVEPDPDKDEGFTKYSHNGDNKGEDGPADAYSKYVTWDFVLDKELSGKGLNKEEAAASYSFTVDLEGPAGLEIQVVTMKDGAKFEDEDLGAKKRVSLGDDGKYQIAVSLKNNEWFEISGLPNGVKYSVKENLDDSAFQVYTAQNVNNHAVEAQQVDPNDPEKEITITVPSVITMTKGTKDDSEIVSAVSHEGVIAVAKTNSTDTKTVTGEIVKLDTLTDVDVQNVLFNNNKPTVPVTGVIMNVAPYALMVIAAAIFAGLFISKKRQEEEI